MLQPSAKYGHEWLSKVQIASPVSHPIILEFTKLRTLEVLCYTYPKLS